MKAFKNASIYVQDKGIIKTDLIFDEKIVAIGGKIENAEIIDLPDDAIVLPGFIDQHIHGASGSDAMDGEESALNNIAVSIAKEGVTSFLATTMTEKKEKIIKALTAIGEYIEKNHTDGARVLGAHLEGPFIATKFCGAQDPKYIVKPNLESFSEFYKVSKGNIRMVTLAPEEDNENLIKELVALGVTASAGHTNAKHTEIVNALENGLNCITHTYNVQSPLHHREIGVVGSALLLDDLYSECICDGVHISIPAIKILLKNKPSDKFVVISDAMRAKNLPDGESELGGQKVIVKNGEARLENGALAGSVLNINKAIENLVKLCDVEFTKAVDFATINPASNLGIAEKYGSIKVGKVADFAVMNSSYSNILTIRDGKIIYKA